MTCNGNFSSLFQFLDCTTVALRCLCVDNNLYLYYIDCNKPFSIYLSPPSHQLFSDWLPVRSRFEQHIRTIHSMWLCSLLFVDLIVILSLLHTKIIEIIMCIWTVKAMLFALLNLLPFVWVRCVLFWVIITYIKNHQLPPSHSVKSYRCSLITKLIT